MAVGFESLGSFSTLFAHKLGHPPGLHRAHVLEVRGRRVGFVPYCFLLMAVTAPKQPDLEIVLYLPALGMMNEEVVKHCQALFTDGCGNWFSLAQH